MPMPEPEADSRESDAKREHRCAVGHMGGGDVRRFVAPNDPGAERDLASEEQKPDVGKARERPSIRSGAAREKQGSDHAGGDDEGDKTMGHLQPNVRRGYVRKSTCLAPGVYLSQLRRGGVGNDRPVGSREIEDRKVTVLMPHGRAETELEVDDERRADNDARESANA